MIDSSLNRKLATFLDLLYTRYKCKHSYWAQFYFDLDANHHLLSLDDQTGLLRHLSQEGIISYDRTPYVIDILKEKVIFPDGKEEFRFTEKYGSPQYVVNYIVNLDINRFSGIYKKYQRYIKYPTERKSKDIHRHIGPQAKFNQIKLIYYSNDNIRVFYKNYSDVINYKILGFHNRKKNGKPVKSWALFLSLFSNRPFRFPRSKKEILMLRQMKLDITNKLKTYFGIKEDPFYPYYEKQGYLFKFKAVIFTPGVGELFPVKHVSSNSFKVQNIPERKDHDREIPFSMLSTNPDVFDCIPAKLKKVDKIFKKYG